MISTSDKINLLKKAKNTIYSWDTNDLTSQLAKEVMSIGYAKIKLFYEALGIDPNNIIIIFGPDGSVTRNKNRFSQGVGYGCAVATKEYIFPSLLHPNGCGYGLYAIEDLPLLKTIIKKLENLKREGVRIQGKIEKWDIWKSNHFIDILRLDKIYSEYSNLENWLSAEAYVLIHSSQQIETQKLIQWLPNDFIKIDTPFGEVEGLTDDARKNYLSFFLETENFSQEKRNSIANELFNESNITFISNQTHQGYFKEKDYFVMRLGLYNSQTRSGAKNLPMFPLGFNAYSFIYLYEGKKNINAAHWTNKQTLQAEENNHSDFLKNMNILPHGGGYKLNYPYSAVKQVFYNNKLFFDLYDAPMESHLMIQDIEALEYGYRGPNEILSIVDKYEMGKRVARFVPTLVIKF